MSKWWHSVVLLEWGLFVGSSVVIQSAGPAAILSFLITGVLIILVMRMLGELATASPVSGSFYAYAPCSRFALFISTRRLHDGMDVLVYGSSWLH